VGLKTFYWFQDNVRIYGYIRSDYSFIAIISTFDHEQNLAGNARDGYDAKIDLGIAFGRLRFSLENDNRLFVARGSLEYTEGRNVKIDAVLVDYLAISTSKAAHTSIWYAKDYEYRQDGILIEGFIAFDYYFEARISTMGNTKFVTGNCRNGYDAVIELPVVTGILRFSIEDGGRSFVARGSLSYSEGRVTKVDAVLVNDLAKSTSRDVQTSNWSVKYYGYNQGPLEIGGVQNSVFLFQYVTGPIEISGWIDGAYNLHAKVKVMGLEQPIEGNCRNGIDARIRLPTGGGNLRFSIDDGGKALVVRGSVSVIVIGSDYKINAVLRMTLQVRPRRFAFMDSTTL
jgi:hypothetical protein